MKEYLEKYPEQKSDVEAAIYAWGREEFEKVAKEALKKGKQIKFIIDPDRMDYLDYEL